MSAYSHERERRERRRRNIARAVCLVIAVALLASLIIPAIFSGLWPDPSGRRESGRHRHRQMAM